MKKQSAFPTEVPPELWNGSRMLEAEQTARVAVPWNLGLAYGIHRFGVTWSMPRGKASPRSKFCLTTALLIFPATALVHGLGFEVTALPCSTFRWEHRSTPWVLRRRRGVKEIVLSMFGSLRHWKVKLLWLGALWGKLLFSWDCSPEGDGECCLSSSPEPEQRCLQERVRCLLNISCQIFFMRLLLAAPYLWYRLAEIPWYFPEPAQNSLGLQACRGVFLYIPAYCIEERGS